MRAGRLRRTAFAIVAAVAVAIGALAYATDLFAGAELDTVDTRFSVRGTQPTPEDVAVVAIDDHTFSALDKQWPFPRSLHAEMIDLLSAAGARVIAYDVQFTEQTTRKEDNALIGAVDRAGGVVLATTEADRGEANVFGGDAVVRSVGARVGITLIDADSNGVVRRIFPRTQGLEAFAVAAADQAAGGDVPADHEFSDDGAWIDYAGGPGTVATYSFADVLKHKVDPKAFAGKVVVVGATSPILQDVHATAAGGGLMAGPELQANTVTTVLDDLPLRSTPAGVDLLLIGILGLVGPLAGYRGRPVLAFALAIAAGGLYLLLAQLAFNNGAVVPVVDPLLALLIGAVGMLGLHYLLAAVDRQRARDTFARFVPADVVDEVLAQTGGEPTLGGVRRECTLLFSDIRGFTTYSESRPPADVVEVLNHYLGAMTDAIMNHGGTLVAYMGDGIMAVFGAPLVQPDHADRAIAAAQEMLDVRLPAFNEWMQGAGQGEGFRMGIGLNSGEVLSGQVGSQRRMEYTTIGDTVNAASRLEGMTKGSGHQLFISETTERARQSSEPELVVVGDMEVRGREATIRVFSLTGPDDAAEPAPENAQEAGTAASASSAKSSPLATSDSE